MKKYKVIIDTDPGVDDTTAIVYMLNDPQFDIKLFSIVHGNVPQQAATRNICHLLDKFGKDIPVVKGCSERLGDNTEEAVFLHGKEGLGAYNPPKTTKTKPLKKDCAAAMYEILKQYPHEVSLIVLGPHTDVAHLFMKYPDAKDLVKEIVMMGGAPNGIKANPAHRSFNIRTDVPAFKETLRANIPVVMCPSRIGRDVCYFTEDQVNEINGTNEVGQFLVETFQTYWEPDYPEKIIATNDICAVYHITKPRLYKTKRAFIEVDDQGKTIAHYDKKGNFRIVLDLKRKPFQKMLFKKLKEMNFKKQA
ncbi:MAG: hypothetical protein E7375_03470 [Clostridiales bacterium]|nr:hypothetical protein [Clostridiales bacterium]